jgi:signal transduction histidine kinase
MLAAGSFNLFSGEIMEKQPLILVVDDEERNLRLLESILIAKNYSISVAREGAEALAKAGSEQPDVILLDVMMPVMDGFEACRRLKADAQTAPIPVLLVTALESRPDRLKGIEAGATDFISKPIDIEYLLLKVRNALYAKNLFNMAQKNYEEQKRLEEVRDKLTHMIVHDLRTPLMGISGNMELLKVQAGSILAPEQMRYVDHANFAVWTMVELVNSILAVNRFEQGNIEIKLNQDNLKDIALEAIELLGSMKSKCRILVSCSPEPPCAPCDRDLIRRVMLNLLSNAVKYTTSGENIRIAITAEEGGIRVKVTDDGPGVPEQYHEKIFEKFGQVAASRERMMYSTGLGLAFCKMAVEAHGGEIGIESEEGKGSTFWFFLPCAPVLETAAAGS